MNMITGEASIKRHGKDITLVSWGNQVNVILKAAEIAAKECG